MYVEGSHCPLARHGHSRDHRPDRPQIEFGLLTDERGCPVAVRGLPGQHRRPRHPRGTRSRRLRVRLRPHRHRPRGRPGDAHLRPDRAPARDRRDRLGEPPARSCDPPSRGRGRPPARRCSTSATSPRSRAPTFPGERLVVCRNPGPRRGAGPQARGAAGRDRGCPREGQRRGRSRAGSDRAAAIGLRARAGGRTRRRWPSTSSSTSPTGPSPYHRRTEAIAAEAALDGLYVVRTSVGPERLDAPAVVETYKRLSAVERDFRALKGDDLAVRPIFHWREDRVRAHLFLCFLAAYVRWHLEAAWAPLLFRDEVPPERADPGRAARRARRRPSPRSATTGRPTACGPAASPRLMAELATLTRNRVMPAGLGEEAAFDLPSEPTPLQARAFELIGVAPASV
ncbi:MAG: hypothetical protein MZW92_59075 [Comamonadaceae bacterium]|nr:hypothetical protein [Comamonadaceae bacterium]